MDRLLDLYNSEAGLLIKDPQGKQVYYRANTDCPIYEELASILRKTSGIADVLAEHLSQMVDSIKVAFVFGSVACGNANAASDIDILLVGEAGFADVVKALYPAKETLGREINPKVYSLTEWQHAQEAQNSFIKDAMKKPKPFVIGTKDDIG